MQDREDIRAHALGRLDGARLERARCSHLYESARGSSEELPALTELEAAEEQRPPRDVAQVD